MAQIRGTAGYGLNNQFNNQFNSNNPATSDPSPLDQIREQTSKIEDMLNSFGEPLKP
jgi:ER-derived vesicles protein